MTPKYKYFVLLFMMLQIYSYSQYKLNRSNYVQIPQEQAIEMGIATSIATFSPPERVNWSYDRWNGHRFSRRQNALDGEVTATFYKKDEVTREKIPIGSIKLQLTGQAKELVPQVGNKTLAKGEKFRPVFTIYYTDGTSETGDAIGSLDGTKHKIEGDSTGFHMMVDDTLVYQYIHSYIFPPKSGHLFHISPTPANSKLTCHFYLEDGNTVYATIDFHEADKDPGVEKEVAKNSTSKNKERKNDCSTQCGGKNCSFEQSDQKAADGSQCEKKDIDPIYMNNLEFTVEETDLFIPGRGLNFEFTRTYRSRKNFSNALGWNWAHNYQMRFVEDLDDPNTYIFYNGAGRGDTYTKNGNTLEVPDSDFKKATIGADGYITVRNRNGTTCKFYPMSDTQKGGRLAEYITRCGNRMIFSYNIDGTLKQVLDSLSRPINFYYDNNYGKLSRIIDFSGRQVKYTYDTNGDLVEVIKPAVTGTPNGNDFPNGKITRYTYSTGFDDNTLNHNILTMTNPNEVANDGPPSVINYYDSDDRMISQEWGGTNASGISAGGTTSISREVINEGVDPDNSELPREVITQVDRNGNETIEYYNNKFHLIKKEVKTRGVRSSDPESFVTTFKYTEESGLLKEIVHPQGNKTVYEYDENNPEKFQRGNLLSVTKYPDPTRKHDQEFIKISYQYEPIYNQVWKVTESRGNDPSFTPQNGGTTSSKRYTVEYVPDYFEGGLDTPGCSCGHTLREIVDMFGIDITPIQAHLNQGDLNGDGQYSLCGNTIVTRLPKVNLRENSPQIAKEGGAVQIIESIVSYNQYGQLNFTETPEGERTLYLYYSEKDPDGDGLNLLGGLNNAGKVFDANGGGYLKEVIADHSHSAKYRGEALPRQISTEIGYDRRGNTIWTIDGRGVKSEFIYNQLNQIVEVQIATNVSQATESHLTAYSYKARTYYDFNDNIIKIETQYKDGNNPDLPEWIATTYQYDILGQVIETTQTVNNNETITSKIKYDSNGNVVEMLTPLAVDGIELNNKVQVIYDERDFVFKTITAPDSGLKTIVTRYYDKNGNLKKVVSPIDNSGDGKKDFTVYTYDGFDRARVVKDALGNTKHYKYDPASNVIRVIARGPIGGLSRTNNTTAGNVELSRTFMFYDELSRVYKTEAKLFVPNGVTTTRPVTLSEGDEKSNDKRITGYVDYDRNSRVTFTTAPSPADKKEMTSIFYDGLSRTVKTVDAQGNNVVTEYDKNSNVVKVTTTEKHPTTRVVDHITISYSQIDSLNRVIRTTDALGQTSRFYYDSRNALYKVTDGSGDITADPINLYAGNINTDGNVTEVVHDGLGREIKTIRILTDNGLGSGNVDIANTSNPDGKIIEESVWDANSRLISVMDDKGNMTSYSYDIQNRLVKTTFADKRKTNHKYNRLSQIIKTTDNNRNIVNNTYDGIGRLVKVEVTRSAGTKGTTEQTFEYDGLSRLTKATDNNDPDDVSDDSVVERKYDSLGRTLEEVQNGKVVSYNWTQGADPVDLTYPNGRKLEYGLDILNRLSFIKNSGNSGNIVSYDYLGSKLIEKNFGNGTRFTTLNDAGDTNEGYDNLGRIVKMRYMKGNELIAGFAYGYNRANMKTYKEDLRFSHLSEVYEYDSVYRLKNFKRGVLNADKTDVDTPSQAQSWKLDGVGNWVETVDNGDVKTQTVNAMNEYKKYNKRGQQFDHNGNTTDDWKFVYTYDFANRIKTVNRKENGELVASYAYDAFNRRIKKKFEKVKAGNSYIADSGTIGLFHFELGNDVLVDSSGNVGNTATAGKVSRVDGQFGTKAGLFQGLSLLLPKTAALDNFTDEITVEAWVFLGDDKCNGVIIKRPGSYNLKIGGDEHRLKFVIFTEGTPEAEREVVSNRGLPLAKWVHVAGVYNGSEMSIYVDGVKSGSVAVSGNISKAIERRTRFGGGVDQFHGIIEEARISNVARTSFEVQKDSIERGFFYNGFQCVEERESVNAGSEVVTRQFVDGVGIDEHVCVDYYNSAGSGVDKTYYYCTNHRGDVVALTDNAGDVAARYTYSAYGVGYAVNEAGVVSRGDYSLAVYGFQGRRHDGETSLVYFRNRYYSASQGRFISRDPLGYVDSYGLYEAFGGNPFNYGDPEGLFLSKAWNYAKNTWKFAKGVAKGVVKTALGIAHTAVKTAISIPAGFASWGAYGLGYVKQADWIRRNLTLHPELQAIGKLYKNAESFFDYSVMTIVGLPTYIGAQIGLPFVQAIKEASEGNYEKSGECIGTGGTIVASIIAGPSYINSKRSITKCRNAAKKMGFQGKVNFAKGNQLEGAAAGLDKTTGNMLVDKNAYKYGYDSFGVNLKGNAIVAHEVGHIHAPISYEQSFGNGWQLKKKYWLRESQASQIGANIGAGAGVLSKIQKSSLLKHAQKMLDFSHKAPYK